MYFHYCGIGQYKWGFTASSTQTDGDIFSPFIRRYVGKVAIRTGNENDYYHRFVIRTSGDRWVLWPGLFMTLRWNSSFE